MTSFAACEDEVLPEQRRLVHLTHPSKSEHWELLDRYSSLTSLFRVTAWCRRWVQIHRSRCARLSSVGYNTLPPFLTSVEMHEATMFWVQHIQCAEFANEITLLQQGRTVPMDSSIAKLAPLLDDQSVLRVGGRLKHALLQFEEKHPAILPKRSHFTTLLIRHYYHVTLHGGVQLTLSTIRRRFWIPQGRQVVKACINQCLICVKWRALTKIQIMGNLPQSRVVPARPFLHTGLEYAGPFQIRTSKGRGHKSYKGYVVLFVCCSTKAVHIELVSDYSTAAFLAAYRRFVSRRGLCVSLRSDCGTNLVGASSELRRMLHAASEEFKDIARQLATDGVEWRFNPLSASHFDGLWEAAVKSVKFHLRRVISETTMTFEELYTLLTQIEASLNSRPMQALSDYSSDYTALTPGHFLIGAPLLSVPKPLQADLVTSNLNRWRLIQRARDDFWRRWSQKYLHTLQTRTEWWR